MAGNLVQVGATLTCPHAGQVQIIPGNARVKINGQPAATEEDTYVIVGCSFLLNGIPHPCTKVQWMQPASRVKIGGRAAILQMSSGLCQASDQAVQGAPAVLSTQARVKGI